MTEIGLKDVEKAIKDDLENINAAIKEEHDYNSRRFGAILDDLDKLRGVNNGIRGEKEEDIMDTEEPEDTEKEDQLPGAKANDMNKWQL
eukprot:8590262-Heterocapsa_arctica.AAC.1